jgi:hypothetical protein
MRAKSRHVRGEGASGLWWRPTRTSFHSRACRASTGAAGRSLAWASGPAPLWCWRNVGELRAKGRRLRSWRKDRGGLSGGESTTVCRAAGVTSTRGRPNAYVDGQHASCRLLNECQHIAQAFKGFGAYLARARRLHAQAPADLG